jgi:hypothetical protein
MCQRTRSGVTLRGRIFGVSCNSPLTEIYPRKTVFWAPRCGSILQTDKHLRRGPLPQKCSPSRDGVLPQNAQRLSLETLVLLADS